MNRKVKSEDKATLDEIYNALTDFVEWIEKTDDNIDEIVKHIGEYSKQLLDAFGLFGIILQTKNDTKKQKLFKKKLKITLLELVAVVDAIESLDCPIDFGVSVPDLDWVIDATPDFFFLLAPIMDEVFDIIGDFSPLVARIQDVADDPSDPEKTAAAIAECKLRIAYTEGLSNFMPNDLSLTGTLGGFGAGTEIMAHPVKAATSVSVQILNAVLAILEYVAATKNTQVGILGRKDQSATGYDYKRFPLSDLNDAKNWLHETGPRQVTDIRGAVFDGNLHLWARHAVSDRSFDICSAAWTPDKEAELTHEMSQNKLVILGLCPTPSNSSNDDKTDQTDVWWVELSG